MAIGYACLTLGVGETNIKTCNLKNASPENLESLIRYNLNSLSNIIDYNIQNNIKLFRISSDIIPFGSSRVNNLNWSDIFAKELSDIGEKIKGGRIRVSMHPGQYTVLNSLSEDVVSNATFDLKYHRDFLDSLKVDSKSKIVLHIGGVYGDKKSAIERFGRNYNLLDESIKKRLIIENDDKNYNIKEVLDIGNTLQIPVVYDNLHNKVNCYDKSKDDNHWIKEASKTWKNSDGVQKVHYSQQNSHKKAGSHSMTIGIEEFMNFYDKLEDKNVDIMLEVKDKNLSAIKCINSTNIYNIKTLEKEWGRYKYLIMEHSQNAYNEIRNLLKDKNAYPSLEFYKLIEDALNTSPSLGSYTNTAEHIWGYFKNKVTEKEKQRYLAQIQGLKTDIKSVSKIKACLYKFSQKYNDDFVIKSYYFITIYDNM